MTIYNSFSQENTESLGDKMAQRAAVGAVYALIGDLAAGKTAFARGFARGLGVDAEITSPTFGILNEYRGRLPLYHFDVYRICHAQEMEDTGYEEYFYGDGVCLVEWADLIEELLPRGVIYVHFEKDDGQSENFRRITVKGGEA